MDSLYSRIDTLERGGRELRNVEREGRKRGLEAEADIEPDESNKISTCGGDEGGTGGIP